MYSVRSPGSSEHSWGVTGRSAGQRTARTSVGVGIASNQPGKGRREQTCGGRLAARLVASHDEDPHQYQDGEDQGDEEDEEERPDQQAEPQAQPLQDALRPSGCLVECRWPWHDATQLTEGVRDCSRSRRPDDHERSPDEARAPADVAPSAGRSRIRPTMVVPLPWRIGPRAPRRAPRPARPCSVGRRHGAPWSDRTPRRRRSP
jgi:hypothetical protein